MTFRVRACLYGAIFVAVVAASSARPAHTQTCVTSIVEVDTTLWDGNYIGVRCGEAPGQTFVARDTLIESVTVWRAARQTPYYWYVKLWVTEVDSTGKPRVDRVLREGPVITVPLGDGIHPIEMKFVLDPPCALPGPGQYYFAVQDYCGGIWDFLANNEDPYPDGQAWRSDISCHSGCYLRQFMYSFPWADMLFRMEFCSDVVTPTRQQSWGRLKIRYQ